MPKPPRDLDYFDKVNYVIDSWAQPCQAPWYIYIETLKPALLEAFIVLISFGWADVLRGFARPPGLGHRRTGKRRGKYSRRIPRFPELGNLVGKHLPVSESVKGIKWSNGFKTLWRIDGHIQVGLFFWLVADVAVDFAYNWTSLLYATVWCEASDNGRFAAHGVGSFLKPGNVWTKMSPAVIDYNEGDCFWAIGHGHSGSKLCVVACAGAYKPWSGNPAPTEIGFKIVHRDTGAVIHQTGPDPVQPGTEPRSVVSGEVPPNTEFTCWSIHNAVGAFFEDSVVTGHQPI